VASGLNHFCDLKTCKNRIFSKRDILTQLILDPWTEQDKMTAHRKGLKAQLMAPHASQWWGGGSTSTCYCIAISVWVGSLGMADRLGGMSHL